MLIFSKQFVRFYENSTAGKKQATTHAMVINSTAGKRQATTHAMVINSTVGKRQQQRMPW